MILRQRSLSIFLLLALILLSAIALLKFYTPKPKEPYNVHLWRLSDGTTIKYFEIWDGHPGFTANLFQYLIWQAESGIEKKYLINIGGSYTVVQLYEATTNKVIWLKGKEAGIKGRDHIIAILDLTNGGFINSGKLHWDEKDLTEIERRIRKLVVSEPGVIIDE